MCIGMLCPEHHAGNPACCPPPSRAHGSGRLSPGSKVEGSPRNIDEPVESWLDRLLARPLDVEWYLVEVGAENIQEPDIDARLAIGNGAFGIRGSFEQPPLVSRPATFI